MFSASYRKYACYAMCPHADMPGMPTPFIQNISLSHLLHFCFFTNKSFVTAACRYACNAYLQSVSSAHFKKYEVYFRRIEYEMPESSLKLLKIVYLYIL